MHWRIDHLSYFVSIKLLSQNQPGSGSSLEFGSLADWANVVVAVLSTAVAFGSFWFAIRSYNRQEKNNREAIFEQREKDRTADQKQKERDQAAKLELEQLRQKTIRLAWYRDTVKVELRKAYTAFETLHTIKDEIRNPDLSEDQKDDLSKKYRQAIFELRNGLLERVVYIHPPTYRKLRDELDRMIVAVDKALFNDSLKLSHNEVYEQEIGGKIKGCQKRFFQMLYAYQGDEYAEPELASQA